MVTTELQRAKLFAAEYFVLCQRYGIYIERIYSEEALEFNEVGDEWWEQHKKDVKAAMDEIARREKRKQYMKEYRKRKRDDRHCATK